MSTFAALKGHPALAQGYGALPRSPACRIVSKPQALKGRNASREAPQKQTKNVGRRACVELNVRVALSGAGGLEADV